MRTSLEPVYKGVYKPRFGLVWVRKEIEHERAINDDFVILDLDESLSCGDASYQNLIIEGDNFDALRYLRMTIVFFWVENMGQY